MHHRVVLVIDNLVPGGAENVLVSYANSLFSLGYDVEVLSICTSSSEMTSRLAEGIKNTTLECKSVRTSFISMLKYIKNQDDLSFLVFNHQVAIITYLASKVLLKKNPIIARCINVLSKNISFDQRFLVRYIYSPMYKLFYRRLDHYIAQCNAMKNDLINFMSIPASKIDVIYNPVAEKYKNCSSRATRSTDTFLFVGRFSHQKGIDYLRNIIIKSLHRNNDNKFVIIGDGPEKDLIKSLLPEFEESVYFANKRSDLSLYYNSVTAVILTSRYEGFPNVLNESICCGTPVVSFDCVSGPSEIISSPNNGILVDSFNVEQFVLDIENVKKIITPIQSIVYFDESILERVIRTNLK